ncbi:MAG: hypothetical protein CM15mV47_640 [uncultured marine virus]|nr:MAG: hypothetical protein CM15mV47_640 [uncultured marine virus]
MDIPNIDVVYEHGITEADARYLAMNDIRIVENELCKVHTCVEDLDAVRQLILMDMAFNMGFLVCVNLKDVGRDRRTEV